MTLRKGDLDVRLAAIRRQEVEADAVGTTTEEEIYAKTVTRVGQKDDETLGGVKSLGKESITPNEVIDNTSVAQVTDDVGIQGFFSPPNVKEAIGLLSNKKKSGIVAVSAGGPSSVVNAQILATARAQKTANDISTFANDESSDSSVGGMNIPTNIQFGTDRNNTVKNISGVSSLSGQPEVDNVSNETGVSGLSPKQTKVLNALTAFATIDALSKTNLSDLTGVVTDFTNDVEVIFDRISTPFENGMGGFLQNVGESITGAGKAFLRNIVPGGISLNEEESRTIFEQNETGDPTEKTKAVKTIVGKSGNVTAQMKGVIANTKADSPKELSNKVTTAAQEQGVPEKDITDATNEINTVDSKLSQLDTTIGGSVVVSSSLFAEPEPLTSTQNKWNGKTTPQDAFTFVSSVEELDADFATIQRDVTEVVIHATETYSNKNIGSPEIHDIHNELGHDGIGFHYVIRRDGTLQRGRPINQKGEHASVNGHDDFSIGIVMVGGIKAPAGQENPLTYLSAHSFNRAQFTTLEKFLASYYRKFPGGQVFGHNDIDIDELDPYFDVPDYIDSVFRKSNKTTDPLNKGPLKPSEIV